MSLHRLLIRAEPHLDRTMLIQNEDISSAHMALLYAWTLSYENFPFRKDRK
jgi:hypothetical protein